DRSALTNVVGPGISLGFLTLTAVILVADLERPARFYYILVRPNWRSWMVWGAYFLTAQGALTTLWLAAAAVGMQAVLRALIWPPVVAALLTPVCTGFLFAQGLARDLWQGPQSTIDLLAQAIAEGAAALLIASAIPGLPRSPELTPAIASTLAIALAVHLALIVFEHVVAPSPTRHHQLAAVAIRGGAFASLFWSGAIAATAASTAAVVGLRAPLPLAAAAAVALAGSFAWELIWVEAGQSVPLS